MSAERLYVSADQLYVSADQMYVPADQLYVPAERGARRADADDESLIHGRMLAGVWFAAVGASDGTNGRAGAATDTPAVVVGCEIWLAGS